MKIIVYKAILRDFLSLRPNREMKDEIDAIAVSPQLKATSVSICYATFVTFFVSNLVPYVFYFFLFFFTYHF